MMEEQVSPAKDRYAAALRDSPTERGRARVVRYSPSSSSSPTPRDRNFPPPPPPPPPREGTGSSRVTSRWEAAISAKNESSSHSEPPPRPFNVSIPAPPPPPPLPGPPPSRQDPQFRVEQRGDPRVQPTRLQELSPQLAHQKKQWDASKDIPRGTVANSPFQPVLDPPSPPPPQLLYQNQWDAKRDVPSGKVSQMVRINSSGAHSQTELAINLAHGHDSGDIPQALWTGEKSLKNPGQGSPSRSSLPPQVQSSHTQRSSDEKEKVIRHSTSEENQFLSKSPVRQWFVERNSPRGNPVAGTQQELDVSFDELHGTDIKTQQASQQQKQCDAERDRIDGESNELSSKISVSHRGEAMDELDALMAPALLRDDGSTKKPSPRFVTTGTDPWILPETLSTNPVFSVTDSWGDPAATANSQEWAESKDWFNASSFGDDTRKDQPSMISSIFPSDSGSAFDVPQLSKSTSLTNDTPSAGSGEHIKHELIADTDSYLVATPPPEVGREAPLRPSPVDMDAGSVHESPLSKQSRTDHFPQGAAALSPVHRSPPLELVPAQVAPPDNVPSQLATESARTDISPACGSPPAIRTAPAGAFMEVGSFPSTDQLPADTSATATENSAEDGRLPVVLRSQSTTGDIKRELAQDNPDVSTGYPRGETHRRQGKKARASDAPKEKKRRGIFGVFKVKSAREDEKTSKRKTKGRGSSARKHRSFRLFSQLSAADSDVERISQFSATDSDVERTLKETSNVNTDTTAGLGHDSLLINKETSEQSDTGVRELVEASESLYGPAIPEFQENRENLEKLENPLAVASSQSADNTTVSEMTNPSIFQPSATSPDALTGEFAGEIRSCERDEAAPAFDLSQTAPFTINSPVLSAGDPFQNDVGDESLPFENRPPAAADLVQSNRQGARGDCSVTEVSEVDLGSGNFMMSVPDPPLESIDMISSDDDEENELQTESVRSEAPKITSVSSFSSQLGKKRAEKRRRRRGKVGMTKFSGRSGTQPSRSAHNTLSEEEVRASHSLDASADYQRASPRTGPQDVLGVLSTSSLPVERVQRLTENSTGKITQEKPAPPGGRQQVSRIRSLAYGRRPGRVRKSTDQDETPQEESAGYMTGQPVAAKASIGIGSGSTHGSRTGRPSRIPVRNLATGKATLAASTGDVDSQKPRSILKKPRLALPEKSAEYSSIDDTQQQDPVLRAGLRLLGAAVIPIQAEMRRFLAKREKLNRMWALIVIQSFIRRHLCEHDYREQIFAIIDIQRVFRGWLVRDQLEDEQYCATQIQRHVRGYLATLAVYEDIYRITLVQSHFRMNAAMNHAAERMALVIQLQSLARCYLVRTRKKELTQKVTRIQTAWRRYYDRMNYEFDLLDVLMLQSLFRQKLGKSTAVSRMASIQKLQAASRRFLGRKHMAELDQSAISIQTACRGYFARTRRKEASSAIIIQKYWRRFSDFSTFIIMLDSAIRIQAMVRGCLELNRSQKEKFSAIMIQSAGRGFVARSRFQHLSVVDHIVRAAVPIWKNEHIAATLIQKRIRGSQAKTAATHHRMARTIQSSWRAVGPRYAYKQERSAVIVQAFLRGRHQRHGYTQFRSAIVIQSAWRGFVCYTDFIFTIADIVAVQRAARDYIARKEYAALCMQRLYRGRKGRANADQYRAVAAVEQRIQEEEASILIQRVARGHLILKNYQGQRLASMMQTSSFEANRDAACATLLCFWWRKLYRKKKGTQIKLWWRRVRLSRGLMAWAQTIKCHVAACTIQEWWRIVVFYRAEKGIALRDEAAARVIQRFFIMVKREVDREIRAAKARRKKKSQWKSERTPEAVDALLESVWEKTVDSVDRRPTRSRYGHRPRSSSTPRPPRQSSHRHKSPEPAKGYRPSESSDRSQRNRTSSNGERVGAHARSPSRRDSPSRKPSRLPPRYYGEPSPSFAAHRPPAESVSIRSVASYDDVASEVSGLSAPTPRQMSSRLGSYSSRDLADDYSLEEAWIDAEITRVKAKHRSVSGRKSSSSRPSNRARHTQQL